MVDEPKKPTFTRKGNNYYKVTNAGDRIIKTHLRYKKPTRTK